MHIAAEHVQVGPSPVGPPHAEFGIGLAGPDKPSQDQPHHGGEKYGTENQSTPTTERRAHSFVPPQESSLYAIGSIHSELQER